MTFSVSETKKANLGKWSAKNFKRNWYYYIGILRLINSYFTLFFIYLLTIHMTHNVSRLWHYL